MWSSCAGYAAAFLFFQLIMAIIGNKRDGTTTFMIELAIFCTLYKVCVIRLRRCGTWPIVLLWTCNLQKWGDDMDVFSFYIPLFCDEVNIRLC